MPEPTVDWATAIVDKMRGVENFLGDNPFLVLLDPSNKFFQVDDVGMIAVMPTRLWDSLLHVHVTFWDRRLRGREGLCRSLAVWVSRFTGKQLFTQIPEDRRILIEFAKRSGFEPQAVISSKEVLLFTNYSG